MKKKYSIGDNGEICEYGETISKERLVKLLNEEEHIIDNLRSCRSQKELTENQLFYYQTRCLKLENGISDCVHGHEDLKKFAKKMGVI